MGGISIERSTLEPQLELGRFLQEDPHPGQLNLPASVTNAYAYVLNNPINFTDPTGEFIGKAWKGIKKIGKAVWGGVSAVVKSDIFRIAAVITAAAFTGGAAAALLVPAGIGGVAGAALGFGIGAIAGGVTGGFVNLALGGSFKEGFLMGAVAGGVAGAFAGYSAGAGQSHALMANSTEQMICANAMLVVDNLFFKASWTAYFAWAIVGPAGLGGVIVVGAATLIANSVMKADSAARCFQNTGGIALRRPSKTKVELKYAFVQPQAKPRTT